MEAAIEVAEGRTWSDANRALHEVGLASGPMASKGHISMRVPDDQNRFVVKGRGYDEDALFHLINQAMRDGRVQRSQATLSAIHAPDDSLLASVERHHGRDVATRLRAEQLRDIGPALAPHSAWLLALGVETLPYRMQAHVDNAPPRLQPDYFRLQRPSEHHCAAEHWVPRKR